MDILTLVFAALAGIFAGAVFDLIKKSLSRKTLRKIAVELPDGGSYELDASKGSQMETELLVRSLIYATEDEPSIHLSNVNLFQDIILPTVQALINRADEKWISIALDGKDAARTDSISVDPAAIQQVVFNLLKNAIVHSRQHSFVHVNVSTSRNDAVVIRFRNLTPAKIPADELVRIFRKGYRGAEALREDPSGTGMGLYVATKILVAHGGDIKVESLVERAKEVFVATVTLPRVLDHTAA